MKLAQFFTYTESGKAKIAVMTLREVAPHETHTVHGGRVWNAVKSNTHCAQRESLECSHIKHTLCTEGYSGVQSHQTHTVYRGRLWSAVTSHTHTIYMHNKV